MRALEASYGCGPADGPFVTVNVVLERPAQVVARVVFRGRYYGESDAVEVTEGATTTFGFDPGLPAGAYGRVGRVELFRATEDTPRKLASVSLRFRNPPGVMCG